MHVDNEVIENELVIMGNFHQGDNRFLDDTRGKQCTPISLVAITYFYKKDIAIWNSDDIDYILYVGDELYRTSKNAIKGKDRFEYLTFDEVFKTVFLHGDSFNFFENFEIDPSSENIKHIEQGDCTVNDLIISLGSFFEKNKYTTGIFTCNNYSFAIMKYKSKYYFFDSHKRNCQGYPALDGEGAAVLCSIRTLKALANRIVSNCDLMITTDDHNYTVRKKSSFSLIAIGVSQNETSIPKKCMDVASSTQNLVQTKKVTKTKKRRKRYRYCTGSERIKLYRKSMPLVQKQKWSNNRKLKRIQSINLETQDKYEQRLRKDRQLHKSFRNSQTQAQRQIYLNKFKIKRAQLTLIRQQNRLTRKKTCRNISLSVTNECENTNQEFAAVKNLFKMSENKESLILRIMGSTKIIDRRLQAEKVVNKIFNYRDSLINIFCKTFIFLKEKLKCSKLKVKPDSDLEQNFNALVGYSLHTSSSENFFIDSTYTNLPTNYKTTLKCNSEGQVVNLFQCGDRCTTWICNNDICLLNKQKIFDRLLNIINVILSLQCSQILNFFENIDNCKNSKLTKAFVTENISEECNESELDRDYNKCKLGHPSFCYINDNCDSVLLFFRSIAPHFPDIRLIVKLLYKILHAVKSINYNEFVLLNFDLEHLTDISEQISIKSCSFIVDSFPFEEEGEIFNHFHSAFCNFKRKDTDWPVNICASCLQLCHKRNVRPISNLSLNTNTEWKKLVDYYEKKFNDYKYICLYCLNKFKNNQIPPTCILNNLTFKPVPECISTLNEFEKILIQRAKAFQVITRMSTVQSGSKKKPTVGLVKKMTGRVFHLPLPLEQTLKKLPNPSDALMSDQEFYVLARSAPSKQNHIWQSLIDINKIFKALQWLKVNNPLYHHIIIPTSANKLLENINNCDIELDCDNNEIPEIEGAMLTQKDVTDGYYSNMTIHPLFEKRSNMDSSTIYQFLKIMEKSLDDRDAQLDLKCFPDLFCYGENGNSQTRQINLPIAEFIKCLLKSSHSQFRLNLQYLFFLLNNANVRQLKAGIFHKLNITNSTSNLTAKKCLDMIASKELEGNLSTIFSRLRNTEQFWSKPRNELNCMVKNYGPATFFLTLSPSEYHWEDLHLYLGQTNTSYKEKPLSHLIALDPVNTSRFVENKFRAMLDFITSDNGPLGTVEHYAWRREYQSRGLQHFHLLLWIKDSPILGKASSESIAEFINKYITCRIPNKSNFPLLHDRVMKYQIHKHNSYCMRAKKVKNKTIRVCRFSFPREISEELHINEVADAVIGRRKLTKTRLYNLPRSEDELYINDYNAVIMLAWCGNIDIQFIGEKSASLTTYITKYQTKAEKSFASDDFQDFCSTKPLYSRLWNFGLRALSNRECGALEAADTLLSHSLFGTDSGTVIRWLDVKINRSRKLKKQNELLELSDDATDIYCSSWIDTHYPRRPKQLENLSLFDFSRWYDIVDKKPLSETVISYEYGGKHLRKRKIPYLINHFNFNCKQEPENYYFCLLILFKSWRKISELKGQFETYSESFAYSKETLLEAMKYHERLEQIQQAKSDLDSEIEILEKKKLSNSHDNDDNLNIINFVEPIGNEIEDFDKLLPKEDINSMIKCLNVDQKRVFDEVVYYIEQYIKEFNTCTLNNVNKRLIPKSILRKFVSGIGGTGKSYLIKVIRLYISKKFNKVAVTAPTGIAAFNINGLTIHRLLQLPVEHGNIPKYSKLSDDKLNSIRVELNNLVLLILDEVSMVSNVMLMHIHMRLSEIFDTMEEHDGWFGRINILFFGDLLQLPPVMGHSPFVNISKEISATHFSGLHLINIWQELLTYDELTINMRQQTDKVYASILDSIRVGVLSDADELILRKREIVLKSRNPSDCLKGLVDYVQKLECKTICLFPTKKQCNLFNAAMLDNSTQPKVILKAVDIIEAKTNAQKEKALKSLNRIKEDNSRTAGLEDEIEVKLGAKIMLLRNIDITNGLVNGAIGFIVKIFKDNFSTDNISKLRIKFETGEFDIEPITAKFQLFTNIFVFRKQFPICLAYGITIHKSQGLTLNTCVVDIGSSIFSSGQVYVALSRVKCLDGLHIINLNPFSIKAQNSAILEYNRLRAAYKPDLKLFSLDKTINNNVTDKNNYFTHLHSSSLIDIENAQIKNHRTDEIESLSHFHGFNNPHGVSCYANSILQCLFNVDCINSAIMLSPSSELKKLCLDFSSPTYNAVLDCYHLRLQFHSEEFDIEQQQDSAEFLQLLLGKYDYLKYVTSFDIENYIKCQSCEYVKQEIYKTDIGILRIPNGKNKFQIQELLDYNFDSWNSDSSKEVKCPNCNNLNVLATLCKIKSTQNILIFSLQLINSNRQKITNLLLSGVPQSKILLCDKNYTLSGAIFHHGETSLKGHYTAIIRRGKYWFKADDTTISKCSWPRNSKDIYILFFKKIE